MFRNKLILLAIVTVAVIAAATVLVDMRAPQTTKAKPAFFPELAGQLESVNRITIKGYAETVSLSRNVGGWGVDEFDAYPALPDKIRGAVLGVADLKINAPKTALPHRYYRLGVEGPEVKDSPSLLLTLLDSNDQTLAEVIIGNVRSKAARGTPGLHVRKPDEEQAYLVDGAISITATPTDWIDRSLLDVPSDTIQSVRITQADGDNFTLLKSERGQEQYELEQVPPGKKVASEVITNRFGTLLQDVQISGARAMAALDQPDTVIRSRVTTFDGIVAEITAFEHDEIPYASFTFEYDASLVPAEEGEEEEENTTKDTAAVVADLNSRTADWWFEISGFKYDILKKRSDSVMRDQAETEEE